jgi:IclR family pca regulon transcriptional regulator
VTKLGEHDAARRAARKVDGGRPADYSEALDRGLAVLAAFDGEHERLTQSDLARRLNLPRATVRRSLLTLAHLGYVAAESRTYRLTPQVLVLASAYLATNPVSRVLQPVCEGICERFGASATTAILDGPWAVMIARALPQQPLGVGHGIGFRVPATRSALGRVLLSALDDEFLHRYLVEHAVVDDNGLTTEQITAYVRDAAAVGYAYVADEVEAGYHSVAVPLHRWDGTPIAALNLGASASQLTRADMLESVLPSLQETARAIRPQLV